MAGRYLVLGAAVLPALSAAAMDAPKYDLKLEKAAMDVIAARIGDIRPGFEYGQQPAFMIPPEQRSREDRAASWRILTSDSGPQAAPSGSIPVPSGDPKPATDERQAGPSGNAARVIEY
ncbi:hypothetical protein RB623_18165 [Mesorhizobium sp. LHD-90]|uniref:hypothetical protein n=1 Tax=Mesorhizobium sp. LHD-90 TaxID=3071414 RepID=UPI0027E04CBD|nr:hypothetical protein [Mesorhizobium sp. LHD-90]MDQ6435985.1 hypothetical protein [Mesorhizobium sp. LHD-90]